MMAVSGQYKKNEQWRKITYVGRGVAGKCYLAVDLQTMAQFAVKKVCARRQFNCSFIVFVGVN